jgi:hypothetical protein
MSARKKGRKSATGAQSRAARAVARTGSREPRSKAPARRAISPDELTRKSIRLGRAHAAQFIESYTKTLRRRPPGGAAALAGLPMAEAIALGPRECLIAKGDSWFNYGTSDILHVLGRNYPYSVDPIAATGMRLVQFANDGQQLDDLKAEIAYQVKSGNTPKAILLSGGGNDIADNFEGFLYHRESALQGWNQQLVGGFINLTIKSAYAKIVAELDALCRSDKVLGRSVPILVHGYAHPVPDGRGIFGNWLMDGFVRQGYEDLAERTALAGNFIDQLNTMLSNLKRDSGIDCVTYVNLRPALSSGADYETYWRNELHPTKFGFEEVTKRIAAALSSLGIAIPPALLAAQLQAALARTRRSRTGAIR